MAFSNNERRLVLAWLKEQSEAILGVPGASRKEDNVFTLIAFSCKTLL